MLPAVYIYLFLLFHTNWVFSQISGSTPYDIVFRWLHFNWLFSQLAQFIKKNNACLCRLLKCVVFHYIVLKIITFILYSFIIEFFLFCGSYHTCDLWVVSICVSYFMGLIITPAKFDPLHLPTCNNSRVS